MSESSGDLVAPWSSGGLHGNDVYTPPNGLTSLLLDGAGGDDVLSVDTSVTVPVTIWGGDGNDLIVGNDHDAFLAGANGNDLILGGDGDELIYGYDGDDEMLGGNGADTFVGGHGTDVLSYADHDTDVNVSLDATANDGSTGEGDDVGDGNHGGGDYNATEIYLGGYGDDTMSAMGSYYGVWLVPSSLTFDGGPGDDSISGGQWVTYIYGSDGADSISLGYLDYAILLSGGAGNDTISGGDDSPNSIQGGSGDDLLYGGAGNDTIWGEAGADIVTGNAGNDSVLGGDGADTLYGNDGNDTLAGGAGNDSIRGGLNNDSIIGGSGVDKMWGEAGNDNINSYTDDFGTVDDTIDGGTGTNTGYYVDQGDVSMLVNISFWTVGGDL